MPANQKTNFGNLGKKARGDVHDDDYVKRTAGQILNELRGKISPEDYERLQKRVNLIDTTNRKSLQDTLRFIDDQNQQYRESNTGDESYDNLYKKLSDRLREQQDLVENNQRKKEKLESKLKKEKKSGFLSDNALFASVSGLVGEFTNDIASLSPTISFLKGIVDRTARSASNASSRSKQGRLERLTSRFDRARGIDRSDQIEGSPVRENGAAGLGDVGRNGNGLGENAAKSITPHLSRIHDRLTKIEKILAGQASSIDSEAKSAKQLVRIERSEQILDERESLMPKRVKISKHDAKEIGKEFAKEMFFVNAITGMASSIVSGLGSLLGGLFSGLENMLGSLLGGFGGAAAFKRLLPNRKGGRRGRKGRSASEEHERARGKRGEGLDRTNVREMPEKMDRVNSREIPEKLERTNVKQLPGALERTNVKQMPEKLDRVNAKQLPEKLERTNVKSLPEKLARKNIGLSKAGKVSKGAGLLEDAKLLGKGARAVPVVGQALTLGLSAYDAYDAINHGQEILGKKKINTADKVGLGVGGVAGGVAGIADLGTSIVNGITGSDLPTNIGESVRDGVSKSMSGFFNKMTSYFDDKKKDVVKKTSLNPDISNLILPSSLTNSAYNVGSDSGDGKLVRTNVNSFSSPNSTLKFDKATIESLEFRPKDDDGSDGYTNAVQRLINLGNERAARTQNNSMGISSVSANNNNKNTNVVNNTPTNNFFSNSTASGAPYFFANQQNSKAGIH